MERFFSFDKLIGSALAKVVYFVGFAVIALVSIVTAVSASNLGGGSLGALLPLIIGAFAILFWRLLIELIIIAFLIYNRLGSIQALLAHGPVGIEAEPAMLDEHASESASPVPAPTTPPDGKSPFCVRCGTSAPVGARFCEKCGATVSATDFSPF